MEQTETLHFARQGRESDIKETGFVDSNQLRLDIHRDHIIISTYHLYRHLPTTTTTTSIASTRTSTDFYMARQLSASEASTSSLGQSSQ